MSENDNHLLFVPSKRDNIVIAVCIVLYTVIAVFRRFRSKVEFQFQLGLSRISYDPPNCPSSITWNVLRILSLCTVKLKHFTLVNVED